ncbi:MAG: glycoside hydrolase domain-containing protein [Phycisphaerae bacterium]
MNINVSKGFERREFLKGCMAAAGAAAVGQLLTGCSAIPSGNGVARSMGNTMSSGGFAGQVRPIVGTGWHGHTFPGASAPFGLVQLSPDTVGPPEPKWNGKWDIYAWDHCGGYHYPDDTILGFSHTHISGTGVQEMGDVLLMPLVEGANWEWNSGAPGKEHQAQIQALGSDTGWVSRGQNTGYASRFSHQQEIVRAGYYSVYLQTPRVKAELTATTRSGMHRYTYPAVSDQTRRGLILDLVHGLGNAAYHTEITIESPTRISGKRYSHGWAKNRQAYFVMEFSAPIQLFDVMVDGHITRHPTTLPKHFSGVQIKAIFQWHHTSVDAQGNEPSNHIPYLYPFAGAAWKTQYWIRKVLALYNNTPNGIPGNDDISQLSSCFAMGALGFYPVNAATGVYVIGSPLINRVKINNPEKRTAFTIIAENNSAENVYIRSAKFNGRELNRAWFAHADIVAGGELYFRMGNKPNKEWASAKADRPPSGLLTAGAAMK